MVEVLDHYHGPHARKLWLIAFAESANNRTRTGWSPRWKLAHRSDISPHHATHTAGELIREGVIKRHGGGYRGQAAVYELLPLDGKGAVGDTLSESKGCRGRPGKGVAGNRKGAVGDTPSLSSPQKENPSSARAGDRELRAALAGLGANPTEIDLVIAEAKTRAKGNLDAYMRQIARRDGGRKLLDGVRARLAAEALIARRRADLDNPEAGTP